MRPVASRWWPILPVTGFPTPRCAAFSGTSRISGGQAIEVVCGSHSADHVLHYARLARHFAFHASRGSDFHGAEESHVDLGGLPALPEDLKPVWRLLDL